MTNVINLMSFTIFSTFKEQSATRLILSICESDLFDLVEIEDYEEMLQNHNNDTSLIAISAYWLVI